MENFVGQMEDVSDLEGLSLTDFLDAITSGLVAILAEEQKVSSLFKEVCEFLVGQGKPYLVSVKLHFNTIEVKNHEYTETALFLQLPFATADGAEGAFSIYLNASKVYGEDDRVYIGFNKQFSIWALLINGKLSSYQLKSLVADHTERRKELQGIQTTNEILNKSTSLFTALSEICENLHQAWQYPDFTAVRIIYDSAEFTSKNFAQTEWVQQQHFETPDQKKGTIEIYYLKEFPASDEGPFLKEERNLLNNLASLISGSVSKNALESLLKYNTERLKELKGLNSTSEVLKRTKCLDDALPDICNILSASFQYSEHTVTRIKYNKQTYQSHGFVETKWKIKQPFRCASDHKGTIEVFYTKEFPEVGEGPFLFEERDLLVNMANLLAGMATKDVFNKLQRVNTERLKELSAINQTSHLIEQGLSVHETLRQICTLLPKSWQYPKYAVCRIQYEGRTYTSERFEETDWMQTENFVTIDNKKGIIDIAYLRKFPTEHEGPFLKEERNLLINIGKLITGYLNSHKGLHIINKRGVVINDSHKSDEFRKSLIRNKKPLQLYFNQQSIDKYIYLDMMRYKVKHILFVATLYDAFMLESEDTFFEKFMGEIYQYSLFSLPRITGVTSTEEALELLETTNFDLIILMVGIDREAPILLSEQIKEKNDSVPVYLLLNKKSDVNYFEELVPNIRSVDRLFVWNGDSQILFSIVKSIEDRINVENDTKIGLVRVILLIEDSTFYYSRYLQMLYSIVFGQVQHILPEVEKNELDKICRMRSRPKILHARNYEEAISIFNKYKEFILCVISDVEFEHAGKMDKRAGARFIGYAKSHIHNLPVMLQSSEEKNRLLANELGVSFLNKNSETLLKDLKSFLVSYLGFGPFVFRDEQGKKVAVANSLREFETLLTMVPDEAFYASAVDNQFSLWLMARGEIQLAKTLNPIPVGSFDQLTESRQFIIEAIKHYREEKKKGKILNYDETSTLDERNIVSFGSGSLGGKGRGLAFINTLIYNLDFGGLSSQINISTPITVIIGTDEFQNFMVSNKLMGKVLDPSVSYDQLKRYFVESPLPDALMQKLKVFVAQIDKPVAVRSSSTSEDSITQPFAGVFDTYILPNSTDNKRQVFELVSNAIKLVYASIYSDDARVYFNAINHRIEDEKMAVIIQELVGSTHNEYYYPHISGVAQSYNYYPVAHMKPEEGFAVAAIGLGPYVVNGWKSYRFSPYYPKVSVYSIKDLLNSTQVKFYALNSVKLNIDLLEHGELAALELLDISEAEKHGTLRHCVSVYNAQNDRIEPGLSAYGPRVVNFANILQYNHIPLAETIKVILRTVEEAFGSPVEIEFAVDLERTKNNLPTFYLLQIKPLVTGLQMQHVDFSKIDKERMVLFTKSSLGNGELTDITDVIYVDSSKFDKLKTLEMAAEIEVLNKQMIKQNRKYLLIGPGRWGTRDQFIGIPVNWSQISNAKVIVEVSLENFPLDSSLGSHFFHNVTSMNIGYLSVLHHSLTDFIKWDILENQKIINKTKYFKHVRFRKPFTVIMDGKQKTAAVIKG
jgi:hypothetical protein